MLNFSLPQLFKNRFFKNRFSDKQKVLRITWDHACELELEISESGHLISSPEAFCTLSLSRLKFWLFPRLPCYKKPWSSRRCKGRQSGRMYVEGDYRRGQGFLMCNMVVLAQVKRAIAYLWIAHNVCCVKATFCTQKLQIVQENKWINDNIEESRGPSAPNTFSVFPAWSGLTINRCLRVAPPPCLIDKHDNAGHDQRVKANGLSQMG